MKTVFIPGDSVSEALSEASESDDEDQAISTMTHTVIFKLLIS